MGMIVALLALATGCSESEDKALEYFDVCDGSVLSEDVGPLERLFPSDASVEHSNWSDRHDEGSLKFTCTNTAGGRRHGGHVCRNS